MGLVITPAGSAAIFNNLGTSSGVKIPANDTYCTMTTNFVDLTPGSWRVSSYGLFSNNGSAVGYNIAAIGVYGSNGSDTGTMPTLLSATSNLTVISSYPSSDPRTFMRPGMTDLTSFAGQDLIITVTATVRIYCVPYLNATAATNARINTYLNASQIK